MVGYNKERKKAEKGMKLIMKKITEHKERFKPDEAPKDYIDSFLMAQHKDGGTEDSIFNGVITFIPKQTINDIL